MVEMDWLIPNLNSFVDQVIRVVCDPDNPRFTAQVSCICVCVLEGFQRLS